MFIEFFYTLASDKNGVEMTSSTVEFKDWDDAFSAVGRMTFLVGAHEKALEHKIPVFMKGLRRRHDLE